MKKHLSVADKALHINLDPTFYGTFAEIGAGQEVARHFFQVGKASQTIAKTMSAYDMIFSDAIYGKSGRYVCEQRLLRMLDHEYKLITERLNEKRGKKSQFFIFADTVAGKSPHSKEGHGWLGVRFQTQPMSEPNDFIIHVRMLDKRRLHQQQALGIVGVNMLYAALMYHNQPEKIVSSLVENLESERIEIDMIRMDGPDVREVNNRILSLELIRNKLTKAVLFSSSSKVLQPSDEMFNKPLFIQRGSFRPITKANIEIQLQGISQFLAEPELKDKKNPQIYMEMTTQNLAVEGEIQNEDFLQRVRTLNVLGHDVLISDCARFNDLKIHLRRYTPLLIGLVIGADQLEKIFDESFYRDLDGGVFEGMGQLFDGKVRLFVYPFKSSTGVVTAENFRPAGSLSTFYEFLLSRRDIVSIPIAENEIFDDSTSAEEVRELLMADDPKWETLVPNKVKDLIQENGFFGLGARCPMPPSGESSDKEQKN